jgi:hypothetical protein
MSTIEVYEQAVARQQQYQKWTASTIKSNYPKPTSKETPNCYDNLTCQSQHLEQKSK